jgi:ComF family protein
MSSYLFKYFDALEGLVDLFLPNLCVLCDGELPRSEIYVCEGCWSTLPPFPDRTMQPLRPLRGVLDRLWIGWEYDTRVRRIVHLLKYSARPELSQKLIDEWLKVITRGEDLKEMDLLVPVPIHPARRRERGFNQSERLARRLGSVLDLPVADQDAVRVINTPSQTLLDREERWRSVAQAFALPEPAAVRNRKILIVDDLATSGATLHALATLLLKREAASVSGAVMTSPIGLDS